MKLKLFFLSIIFFLFSTTLFAEVTVVNPIAGNFANQQTLIIEANEGEEVYYSLSGSDPLSSGFAYDGPVLLEATGDVELRIATIDKSLKHNEIKISYNVTPSNIANAEHNAFFNSLETGPVFEYVAGEKIAVPFTLDYAFGENRSFERGREVSISKDCTIERYLPLSLRDDKNEWRYVLHIVPAVVGQISQREIPFSISNWTWLELNDPKMIYSTDNTWWYDSSETITIDRSVYNTIYYQSANYKKNNPVTKIVLPPKPNLKIERQYGGAIKISVEEPYKIAASSQAKTRLIADGFYSEIILDVFTGDKIEDTIPIDVYADDVYQGTLFTSIALDRRLPSAPTIKSNIEGVYARDNVQVVATAPKNLKIFVGISDAVEVPITFDFDSLPEIKFNEPTFSLYDGSVITLFADTEKNLAYKISFYSEDALGVKSRTVSYEMLIDKYNYYVDASSKNELQDGTPFAPFKDLSQIENIANANEFSRFCIKGTALMPLGEINISSNVEFCGMSESKIQIPETSVIIIKNAGLFAQNITFEKLLKNEPSKKTRGAAKALTNMFIIENSAATFTNCELDGKFSGDGAMLNLSSAVLSLNKTVIVNNAQGYSSALNAIASKIKISDSRFLCISDTSVGVSVNGGSLELANTFIQVSARMARILELIDTSAALEKNRFTAELTPAKSKDELIYKTSKTIITKDAGNIIQ